MSNNESMVAIEVTQAEANIIMEMRRKALSDAAYNQGLVDAHNIVQSTIPMGETRTEALGLIKSLWRGEIPKN